MTKKILIYGGSGGIGQATARLLHAKGYALHLVGRNEEKLASLAEELEAGYTAGDFLVIMLTGSVGFNPPRGCFYPAWSGE